jgi:hypothetical protein
VSKKAANHEHAVAIYFMHYYFVRIHQTLRCTPAMAAGVTPKLWELSDMVGLGGMRKMFLRPIKLVPVPPPNCNQPRQLELPLV